jgi:hypothetical protein
MNIEGFDGMEISIYSEDLNRIIDNNVKSIEMNANDLVLKNQ